MLTNVLSYTVTMQFKALQEQNIYLLHLFQKRQTQGTKQKANEDSVSTIEMIYVSLYQNSYNIFVQNITPIATKIIG